VLTEQVNGAVAAVHSVAQLVVPVGAYSTRTVGVMLVAPVTVVVVAIVPRTMSSGRSSTTATLLATVARTTVDVVELAARSTAMARRS
jgi:hypothetical protein